MSDDLYSTRLRWDGQHGTAKLHGKTVQLRTAPTLVGQAVHSVDYIPEIRRLEVRRLIVDSLDNLTVAEIAAADALLGWLTHRDAT